MTVTVSTSSCLSSFLSCPPLLPPSPKGGARVCWINSTSAHIIMTRKDQAKQGAVERTVHGQECAAAIYRVCSCNIQSVQLQYTERAAAIYRARLLIVSFSHSICVIIVLWCSERDEVCACSVTPSLFSPFSLFSHISKQNTGTRYNFVVSCTV